MALFRSSEVDIASTSPNPSITAKPPSNYPSVKLNRVRTIMVEIIAALSAKLIKAFAIAGLESGVKVTSAAKLI